MEGQFELGHLHVRVVVEAREVAHQDPGGPGVGDQAVDAEVQASAATGQEGGTDVEQRPALGGEDLVGQPPRVCSSSAFASSWGRSRASLVATT